MSNSVKIIDAEKGLIEGLAIPFGGPKNGRDLDAQFFSKDTDFLLGDYEKRPLRYHHGKDTVVQWERVGFQVKADIRDEGVWVQAQIDLASEYAERLQKLLSSEDADGNDVLKFSSGAQEHGVLIDWSTGSIKRWPWVELSLTPTPANPYAVVETKTARLDLADYVKHNRLAAAVEEQADTPSASSGYDDGMTKFESLRLASVGLDLTAHEMGAVR